MIELKDKVLVYSTGCTRHWRGVSGWVDTVKLAVPGTRSDLAVIAACAGGFMVPLAKEIATYGGRA